MGLKLNQLQKVVKNVVKKEKNIDLLREEIVRTLGPTILISRGLERMAESANERIDILEAMDKKYEKVRPALLLKFVDSDSPEVRKLVARLLPESFLKVFMKDSDSSVRAATARRLPVNLVSEMARRFPKDDTLRNIINEKKLHEAGITEPELEDEEFDMYGLEPIGDFHGFEYPDLTDAWYDTLALKIINMYGRNIEEQWEEATVHQFVNGMKSMGVDVDRQKLLDAVYDLLEQRADSVLEENSLAALASKLRLEDTQFMSVISESVDPTKEMITAGYTTGEYIRAFESLFSVKHVQGINPAYRTLREGSEKVVHPVSAQLPGSTFRNVDERAVDSYVNAWNTRESMRGNPPYRLQWTPDSEDFNMVNFHLELK